MSLSSVTQKATTISLQQFADLLDVSTVHEELDLGSARVFKVTHPQSGNITLINTTGETHGVLYN